MDFEFTPEQKAWQLEVRDFIRNNATPELLAEVVNQEELGPGPLYNAWRKKLGDKGWLGIGWPKEYGGQGKGAIEQWILLDELDNAGLPGSGAALGMIGPAIMLVASEEMKQEYLPRILSGDVEFALGYSEPNAGSDLDSLTTRAVIEGDDIIINGSKIWNSGAHFSTHEWLAVRTDPTVPKHKGISVVIVPINSPGIEIRPIHTWADLRTNQIFFDNVRVPRKNLVGELNRGWYYIASALDFERFSIGPTGLLRDLFRRIISYTKETRRNGRPLSEDPVIRNRLASLAIDLQVARLLSLRAAGMVDKGIIPNAESSMIKVFNTELRVKIGDFATQIMGPYGQLLTGDKRAPLNGDIEHLYRGGILSCITGGTNEIQRDIIARRGLGLGRA